MRVVVAGLGVQGHKRRRVAGTDFVAAVDPVNGGAEYRAIEDIPLSNYDAVLACIPDEPKIAVLDYLLGNGKHVLVEKPLWAAEEDSIARLEATARKKGAICYVAYNHRFEPHFVRMRETIVDGTLGALYHCRMFYGNGTARLVRESEWRDKGAGGLPDLGSHLLDTVQFWFGDIGEDVRIVSSRRFENRAPDHVVLSSNTAKPQLELEMTLLSWRNHFTCDLFGEQIAGEMVAPAEQRHFQFELRFGCIRGKHDMVRGAIFEAAARYDANILADVAEPELRGVEEV